MNLSTIITRLIIKGYYDEIYQNRSPQAQTLRVMSASGALSKAVADVDKPAAAEAIADLIEQLSLLSEMIKVDIADASKERLNGYSERIK